MIRNSPYVRACDEWGKTLLYIHSFTITGDRAVSLTVMGREPKSLQYIPTDAVLQY